MVHDLDPVIFALGPLQVRWYGLMYVIGFVLGGWLAGKLVDRGFFQVAKKKIDSLITMMIVGIFICARLAYVFVYNWDYYSEHMGEIFWVWKGGLSFHGALLGILAAIFIFSRKNKVPFAQTADVVALTGTQGLFWGRLGNFINGELYGRRTDSWMGVVFPEGGDFPRHPSQLYEGLAEGILLSALLWWLFTRVRHYGYIACAMVIGYGVFRFGVEFFREPDPQLGLIWGWMTMGQILCVLMVVVGSLFLWFGRKTKIAHLPQ